MKDIAQSKTEHYIADLFSRLGAPLSKKEWIERELIEATENEDYEYCSQLKTELEKL